MLDAIEEMLLSYPDCPFDFFVVWFLEPSLLGGAISRLALMID